MSRRRLNLNQDKVEEVSDPFSVKDKQEVFDPLSVEDKQEVFDQIRSDIDKLIRQRHEIALDESSNISKKNLEALVKYNNSSPLETKDKMSDLRKDGELKDPEKDVSQSSPKKIKKNLHELCSYHITDNRNPSPVLDAKLYTINSLFLLFKEILKYNLWNNELLIAKNHHGSEHEMFMATWEEEHGMRYIVTFQQPEGQAIPTRQFRAFFEGKPSRTRPTHAQGTGVAVPMPGLKVTTAGKLYINSKGLIFKIDLNSGGFKDKFEKVVWPIYILNRCNKALLAETIELCEISKNKPGRKFIIKRDDIDILDSLFTKEEKEQMLKDNLLPESQAVIPLRHDRSEEDDDNFEITKLKGGKKSRIKSREKAPRKLDLSLCMDLESGLKEKSDILFSDEETSSSFLDFDSLAPLMLPRSSEEELTSTREEEKELKFAKTSILERIPLSPIKREDLNKNKSPTTPSKLKNRYNFLPLPVFHKEDDSENLDPSLLLSSHESEFPESPVAYDTPKKQKPKECQFFTPEKSSKPEESVLPPPILVGHSRIVSS